MNNPQFGDSNDGLVKRQLQEIYGCAASARRALAQEAREVHLFMVGTI